MEEIDWDGFIEGPIREEVPQQGEQWDWDYDDPKQYCKHGTFIGSWWGPDLLCGACEAGDEEV